MRPPHCWVCDLNLEDITGDLWDNFALIYFGKTEADKFGPSDPVGGVTFVGHPRNAVWFCTDHAPRARDYEDMPVKEALAAISKLTGSPPRP